MNFWPFRRKKEQRETLEEIEKVKRRQRKVELELRTIQATIRRKEGT